MSNLQHNSGKYIRITITTAKYILETTTNLVTWLHGADYNPETGLMADPASTIPSIFEAQDQTDKALHTWLSQATHILKMIAGIVSFELQRLGDEDSTPTDIETGLNEERRTPPALFDDIYNDIGYDADSDVLYGANAETNPVWDDVSDM